MPETTLPKSIVTTDLDVISCEIDIAAPPERVFKAIVDSVEVRKRSPILDFYEMDARVGGRWRFELRNPQPRPGLEIKRHEGEILELDPPRLLVYSWFSNSHNDPKLRSIVRWELTPTASGTHVKVVHSGLASEPEAAKGYAGGWPGVLEVLKTSVEQRRETYA